VTEEYVVVSTVQGQFTEQQIRAFLEAHGIPTHVRGETLRTTHGISVDGIGAVEILVASNLANEARELLARADRGSRSRRTRSPRLFSKRHDGLYRRESPS
jgi:hypothetical protein